MKWTSLRGRDGVWGGDLVDVTSPWAARDKMAHFLLGLLTDAFVDNGVRLALAFWLGVGMWWWVPRACVLLVAIGVEVVEDRRYRKYGWTRSLSDEADGTDVLVTVAGGLAGWLLL